INCFHAWALRMADVGPAHFYAEGYFCDYPPGYLYVLWLCGAVLRATHGAGLLLVLKMPSIAADLAAVYLLYRWTREKLGDRGAFVLATLYALNPAVLVTGAAWGQIDAVLALGLILTLRFAAQEDYQKAFPAYLITVLVKPQALMLAPLGLCALLIHWAGRKWDKAVLLRALAGLGIGAALSLALLIPFTKEGFGWVIGKYTDTLSSYAYATINTANFPYLLGGNWVALTQPLLGKIPYGTLGVVLMVLVVAYTVFLYARSRNPETLYLVAALTFLGLYVFGYRMHERYLFPALILLALAYAKQRDGRLPALFAGLSVTMFFNVWLVLRNEHLVSGLNAAAMVISFANLAMALWAFWIGYDLCVAGRIRPLPMPSVAAEPVKREQAGEFTARILGKSDYRLNLGRWDWILMLSLTLVYAVVAFVGLGSTKAPQTGWTATGIDETVVFDLGGTHDFQAMYYGGISAKSFTLSTSEDGQTWSEEWPAQMNEGECFRWKYLCQSMVNPQNNETSWQDDLAVNLSGRFVRLRSDGPGLNLFEIVFRDEQGNAIPVQSVEAAGGRAGSENDPALLVDEMDTMPDRPGYYVGTYFDEIYHARTGYEHLHSLNPLETSHPPLGKVLIMFAIRVFGMTPFGWRFAGTVVGILMVPAMYLMGMQLFKQRRWAFLSAFLMAFDCMHLTQTRIATIDSYPVLFIILSYLCMFRYLQMSVFRDGVRRTLVPLALCGLFMGLGMASKWIGIYAGAGLAALFVWAMGMRLREYLHAYRRGSDAARAAVAAYLKRVPAAE
nr:glycosyltransferase family 39 protein [Clostridia bacterium]